MSEKALDILNWVGIAATCIGAICGGVAKFQKVKYEVRKEVDKQMEDQSTTYTYERFEKNCKK